MRVDKAWRNVRLATMLEGGLGIVAPNTVACAEGMLSYAGPAANAPSFDYRSAVYRSGERLRHALRPPHPSAAPARRPDRDVDALRTLMFGSAIRASHLVNDVRVQDPYCLRCQPQVMGACPDLLRQAATTLAIEANGVSDSPLVFPGTGDLGDEALSGGNFHAEPVAFAADMTALAVCDIGSITERRIAMLVDPALSGLPALLTPRPGLNSEFMIPQLTAAALFSRTSSAPIPPASIRSPLPPTRKIMCRWRRTAADGLLDMAANASAVVGIELLAAAQGCDFHAPLGSSDALEAVRRRLRREVPALADDRYFHPDMEAANALVRSDAVTEAAGVELPCIA